MTTTTWIHVILAMALAGAAWMAFARPQEYIRHFKSIISIPIYFVMGCIIWEMGAQSQTPAYKLSDSIEIYYPGVITVCLTLLLVGPWLARSRSTARHKTT